MWRGCVAVRGPVLILWILPESAKALMDSAMGRGGWGDAEQRPIERKLGLMENCRGQQLLTGDRVDYETLYLCNTLRRHFNCY